MSNHLDPARVLGELGKFTPTERLDFYKNRICEATPTENAKNLDRVQFAQFLVSLDQPATVLDVGSHDAFVSRALAADNDCITQVVCIDPCLAALKEAKRLVKADGLANRFSLLEMTWEEMSKKCPNAKFDLVLAFELIEHFTEEESKELLAFLWRSVGEHGRLCMSTPDESGHWGSKNPEREHLQLFTPSSFSQAILDATGKVPDIELVSGLILATVTK